MFLRSILILAALAPLALAEEPAGLQRAVDSYLAAADAEPPSPWKAEAALGLTVTDGNSETKSLNFEIKGERDWEKWKLALKGTTVYAEDTGVESANEQVLTERLDRKLSERASIFQELYAEHDEQEKLTWRVLLTAGYSRLLKKTKKIEVHGEAGGGVLYEDYRTGVENTEGLAQVGADLKWQVTEQLLFTQSVKFFPSLSETGEFRLISETGLSTPISDRMSLKLAIVDKYNSDAPTGIQKNDLTVALNLVIKLTKPKS